VKAKIAVLAGDGVGREIVPEAVAQQKQFPDGQTGLTTTDDVANQRLALAQTMRDDKMAAAELKKNEGFGLQFAQQTYLEHLQAGDDDVTAGVKAAKATAEKFPNVPVDLTKLENPNKKGKLGVEIKMGQEDMSRQFKTLESSQNTIDYVSDLADRIRANPKIVGGAAQLGTAVAGAGQQLRAIAGADPQAAKFLNTKPRDEAEAFYEVLVYTQAKSMDQGALDTKAVKNAREVLGDMNSWTTGPQQMLNKLDIVRANAERSMRRARARLKGGAQSYLQDDTPANKPVSEMNEQELMKAIMGGLN